MKLSQLLAQIAPPDEQAAAQAKHRFDSIAKPLGSLGLLEEAIIAIAALTGNANVSLARRCVAVMCADNGVVAEGVAQTGSDVTAVVMENLTKEQASVCLLARCAGCDVIPVDIGVARDVRGQGLLVHKIAYGTGNILHGPAMRYDQAREAILFGIELAGELKAQGYQIIATGEMGIGNTTTSSAVASVLLDRPVHEMTGRGAGLSDEGLLHKMDVIRRAIEKNQPDPEDPVDVVAKVGGFDLAGLCGVFLGGALYRVPVLIDGFISATAALLAARLCPVAAGCMIAAHRSAEPAAELLLGALGKRPLIAADMRLGEGTGAVAALPLLDMALAVYHEMPTFADVDIESYQPLS